MKQKLKRRLIDFAQNRLHRWGYHVIRLGPNALGGNAYHDLATLTRNPDPIVFDIGANCGQTVRKLRQILPHATIHSFEPSPRTFAKLQESCQGMRGVNLWNTGMGSAVGELTFHENELSELSSFLPLGEEGWGKVERKVSVPVDTVDHFCEINGIEKIDILKTDTQGYDLQVLKGADGLLSEGRVGLIYTEIILGATYENAATFDELYALMRQHDYRLVTFYRISYRDNMASSTDALFARPDYLDSPKD